ncbi:MAG: hypothetical protein DRG27_03825 [Deltaproteobacteria bacterium]|nr:MAG: hypothetical protein DRG27_03825 [Deltaproteobacteria bacterium]
MHWSDIYKKLSLINLCIIGAGIFLLNQLASPAFTFSFLIGAIIAILNFHFLQRKIRSLFKGNSFVGSQFGIVINFYFRLAIIGIIVYILLDKGVDPLGLLIGMSVLSVGILALGIIFGIKSYKRS